jgi:ribosomal peptide maturation radical SAM protein 1
MLVELRSSRDGRAAKEARPARRRVALVVMPAHIPSLPSLGVATLAAGLRERGHEVDVHHLNVEAAKIVGLRTYYTIGLESSWVRKVAEWLFSHPSITPGAADTATMKRFLRQKHLDASTERFPELDLDHLRSVFDGLLDKWAEEVDWASYDVVGFTVMFQQLNASLRLARAIRERAPRTRLVLGGCALEDPMGDAVFSRYPFLDAVFSGYAERSFPAWVDALPARAERAIYDDGVANLDDLPTPSFDDYVFALRQHGLLHRLEPKVLIETSRGCWYGEKQHCTFCGINGLQMRYRNKSGDRVFDEVRALSRYGFPLWAADSILPLEFYDTLFPRLEREGVRFDGFYEIKSNAKRAELETLSRVGITKLQPGIESFSTPILKLMRKGVSGIQNVWFLRASTELGLEAKWNVLWGFPGEAPEEYEKMAALFPKLSHLRAPEGTGKIHLLRHSPNHSTAEELGFSNVTPFPSYELAFGPHDRLQDQAYLFDFAYADGRTPEIYAEELDSIAKRWMSLSRRPVAPLCHVVSIRKRSFVMDTRQRRTLGLGRLRLSLLDDEALALLRAIESPVPRNKLEREWRGEGPLEPLLQQFLEDDWALEDDGRVVRLVVIREDSSLVAELGRWVGMKARVASALGRRAAGLAVHAVISSSAWDPLRSPGGELA